MPSQEAGVLEQKTGRLGRFEFLMMNNPLKRWRQKHWEFALFLGMLERRRLDLRGKAIMDAGCGDGYSTELIVKRFGPSQVMAFDLMPVGFPRFRGQCDMPLGHRVAPVFGGCPSTTSLRKVALRPATLVVFS